MEVWVIKDIVWFPCISDNTGIKKRPSGGKTETRNRATTPLNLDSGKVKFINRLWKSWKDLGSEAYSKENKKEVLERGEIGLT